MRARARIVAEGEVQKAGYRDIVEDIAVKLGVKGFVENLRDKTVCVVCEGEKDVVDRFVDAIKIKNDIVDVKSVKIVETSPATNEFKYFDIKYGSPEEELGERMVAAVKYAKLALHETREVGGEVKKVGEEVKGSREDIQDMHKDMNESFSQLDDNMNKSFGQLNETMNRGFTQVNDTLVGFRDETKTEFQIIKTDYGKISQDLGKAVESINTIAKSIEKLAEAIAKK